MFNFIHSVFIATPVRAISVIHSSRITIAIIATAEQFCVLFCITLFSYFISSMGVLSNLKHSGDPQKILKQGQCLFSLICKNFTYGQFLHYMQVYRYHPNILPFILYIKLYINKSIYSQFTLYPYSKCYPQHDYQKKQSSSNSYIQHISSNLSSLPPKTLKISNILQMNFRYRAGAYVDIGHCLFYK